MKTEKNDESLNQFYKISILVRFLMIFFGFGYLHPDQFFQSSEIVAGDVFGFEVERGWEWEQATRTIVTPALLSGLPFFALKIISFVVNLTNGFTLFYLPRIVLFLASFIADWVVWDLSGHEMSALVTLGTSWVTVIFLLASFSNTTETLLLAVVLYLALSKRSKSVNKYAIIGAVLSIGFFNRFSFALFTFPIVLYLLYEELVSKDKTRSGWQGLLTGLLIGFSLVSAVIMIIDSVYFGSLSLSIGDKPFRWLDLVDFNFYLSLLKNLGSISISSFSWTISPLNSLRYNSNPENLAEHGIHWRLTHALVNLPLLYGPLYVIALLPYYNWLDERLGELIGQAPKRPRAGGKKKIPKMNDKSQKGPRKIVQETDSRPKKLIHELVLLGVIGSGLVFLSFVPHQELRFLVPLLVPFVLLGHKGIFGSDGNKYIQIGWVAFNISMLLIMGIAHQGGMVPSMLATGRSNTDPSVTHNIVYYHTYMPPRHLLTMPKSQGSKPRYVVHDLKGSTVADLRKRLLRIHESVSFGEGDKILVVTPGTVDLDTLTTELTLQRKFWPHLSFEDLPTNFDDYTKHMTLNVYEWQKIK